MTPIEKYSIVLPIERWVSEDDAFLSIVEDIDPLLDDDLEFAHAFYDRMLRKFEIVGDKAVKAINKNGMSTFDDFAQFLSIQTAILKYVMPERPIRQNLIAACYHCLKEEELDLLPCAQLHFGSYQKIPDQFMVYFKDYGPDSTLFFEVEGDDWTKSGAHTAIKEVHSA